MVTVQSKPSDLVPKNYIPIGKGRTLHILWEHWGNGQKFLNIYVYNPMWTIKQCPYLPNILVPQEAFYKFVVAMDTVIRQLPVKERPHSEDDKSPLVLATQIVQGAQHYKFKLSAWHQPGDQWHFDIQSVQNVQTPEENQKQQLYFPFWALPWLREQMDTILMEHDGSERINEMPIIREWATRAAAASDIEQQEQKPNELQAKETEKKWRMKMKTSNTMANRRPFRQPR